MAIAALGLAAVAGGAGAGGDLPGASPSSAAVAGGDLPAALSEALLPGALLPAELLSVDEAFRPGLRVEGARRTVFWEIRPGYYLYRHKLGVSEDGRQLALELPPGEPREDAAFGRVQVYDRYLEVGLPPGRGGLTLRYQGCAAAGYCYPPVVRQVSE